MLSADHQRWGAIREEWKNEWMEGGNARGERKKRKSKSEGGKDEGKGRKEKGKENVNVNVYIFTMCTIISLIIKHNYPEIYIHG